MDYIGVERHEGRYWRAYLIIGGKQVSLGRYTTASHAAKVYNRAATKMLGPLAKLNKVES